MATNETGEVAAIKKEILRAYPLAWVRKIHGDRFQSSGMPDLLVVIGGLLFGIEVKYQRPGESRAHALGRATPLQLIEIDRLRAAGAVAGVVTSPAEALALIGARLKQRRESMAKKWVEVEIPQVGDIAEHVSGTLDARQVARVDGGQVWLLACTDTPIGPFPISNYTFERKVEES